VSNKKNWLLVPVLSTFMSLTLAKVAKIIKEK